MLTPAWSRKRWIAALASVVFLAVGSCSSSDDDDAATTTTTTALAGEVTPTVVCADASTGAAYFGYTNSGSGPVSIAVGEANRITLADGTELTSQQPDVFAPGEQGVVAWAEFIDASVAVSWSITSADGTERTATADATSPPCPDRLPPLDPPDDRDATVVADVEVTEDSSGGLDSATIAISVEGLPDASRCPSGSYPWTPERPDVRIEAVGSNVTALDGADPSIARLEVDDPALAPVAGLAVEGFVSLTVFVDVEDRCSSDDGTASRGWGASESLLELSQIGNKICFGNVDEGYEEVDCTLGPTLALTGGIRSR